MPDCLKNYKSEDEEYIPSGYDDGAMTIDEFVKIPINKRTLKAIKKLSINNQLMLFREITDTRNCYKNKPLDEQNKLILREINTLEFEIRDLDGEIIKEAYKEHDNYF